MAKHKKTSTTGYAQNSSLGEETDYRSGYSPKLLHAIPRSDYRETIDSAGSILVLQQGVDRWRCYELSWLDLQGKPQVAVLEIDIPASSPCIVESKSLKLYLNSLNQHRLVDSEALLTLLKQDLETCLGGEIALSIIPVQLTGEPSKESEYELIDTLPARCEQYQRDPQLLRLTGQQVSDERLQSHLFRSRCPVTGQPDWATLKITYSGPQLERVSLLKYIVSYRDHDGFHEQCIEQVLSDLQQLGDFSSLQVVGQFTRRGGIDICPLRGPASLALQLDRVNRQ